MDQIGQDETPDTGSPDSLARLRDENATLRAAVHARDNFISVAAHELRNPMTPLLGQISLLRKNARGLDGALPPNIAQGIERLDLIVRRYVRRTTTLLDVSRLTSGNFHLELAPINVTTVVSEIAADFVAYAAMAGSTLLVTINENIIGIFDQIALEEIAENLMSNAIKYGSGHPILVTLNSSAGELCFQVTDHGLGISMRDQARIFDQFERVVADPTTTGFGLGLWVVGQLVVAMRGRIDIESQPGMGSTFSVRLPLHTIMEQS